jgi:P4 family phage/plasmid primase-like protien
VATGEWDGSGTLFVVDIDVPGGYETWQALRDGRDEEIPETAAAETPSGGSHLYFRAPPGVTIKSAKDTLGDAVDTKGHGGYVVAPPSQTPDGAYSFRDDAEGVAKAPFWLVSAASKDGSNGNAKRSTAPSTGHEGELDEEVVEDALRAIPPQPDYEKWYRIIAAVKDAVGGSISVAERLLESWSPENGHGEYTYEGRLKSAADDHITAGTLIFYAKEHGWTPPWKDARHDGDPSGSNPARSNGRADEGATASDADPWGKIRSTYQDDKGQARLFAAEQLESDLDVATHRRSGHLYVWDPEGKVYADDGEQSIRSRLMEKLRSDFSQHEVGEIIGMVKAITYRHDFGAEGFIPVANGDLTVTADAVDLKDAIPERGFRTRSPAKWDPEADAPIFRTYLEQVVQTEDERRTLQEYAGYSLMYWGLPYHKALFLVGPQASGKSTFLKVFQEMLGKTTQLSPQQLVDDRFGAIELEDSWANVASDVPSALLSNVARFKEITAGDRIFAERKYEQGYEIEPTAKHFYSANQLPEIKIDDAAFFRRVLIVAFPKTIPRDERDPDLVEKLTLELNGVLRWAVEGLQRLQKNENFTRDLRPEETRRVWDEHSSSIGQFKIRYLEVTGRNGDAEAKQDVYQAYSEFCMENGLTTESQQKLTRVLKRDPRIGQAKRTPAGWDKQTKCYVGVQLPASHAPERLRDEEAASGGGAPF